MRVAWALVLGVSMTLLGCGGGEDDKQTKATYALDDVLHVNQIQAKGSHNSYHIAQDGITIDALKYTHAPLDVQLEDQGVRQFELDTHWDENEQSLLVYHLAFDKNTTCATLSECLTTLRKWSDDHPGHHILFVQIEPKDGVLPPASAIEDYFKHFDDAILGAWPRERVLTPDDVKGDAATLRDAVVNKGFPTLGETRQKILFFIDNSSEFRDMYTRGGTSLDGRLMFVDSEPGVPYEATYLFNDPVPDGPDIASALAQGFLIRTRADSDNVEPFAGDTARRDAALATGAQMISTDYEAPVQGVDYVVEIPGGTPSRCSPVTAPSDCQPTDIENPKLLR